MLETILTGMVIGLSVAAPVGPTSIELIKRGLRSGFGDAWMVGLGAATADAAYLILATLGVAPLITKFPAVKLAMWLFGFLVLGYLGWSGIKDFRRGSAPDLETGGAARTDRSSYLFGLAITLTNPMTIALWLSIAGGVLSTGVAGGAGSGAGASAAAFVAGAALGGVGWFTFLAYLASLGRKYLKPGMFRYIAGIAGVILLLFAARFGFRAMTDIAGMFQ
ncbi:MAG: LysE family translocator [bacterium]|jgi:threonine/homoserine/homoserine lactone efflux protein